MIQLELFSSLKSKKINGRIYHNYKKWEEYHKGLWRKVSGKERNVFLEKAINFTSNTELYGSYMLKVLDEWPISCEQNLSDKSINRKAWIGHAACCMATQCPEEITRLAWHHLSERQQYEANLKASEAISVWEQKYAEN